MQGADFAWMVDAVIGLLIVVSAYLAMVRGFIREIFALISWVVAFFAAFFFAPMVQPMLADVPGLGSLLSKCSTAMLVAFILVFGATLIVTGLVIWLFTGPSRNTAASVVDQGLGFAYGALRGVVLVAVLYIGYQQVIPATEQFEFVEKAFSIGFVSEAADVIRGAIPTEVPDWLQDQINSLTGRCEDLVAPPTGS